MANIVSCALLMLAAVSAETTPETYAPEMMTADVEHISTVNPRLHLVRNFASDFEMDHIIKNSFQNMRPQNQNAETGVVYELPMPGDSILENLEARMRSITPGLGALRAPEFSGDGGDTLRVRRYLPDGTGFEGGDFHPPHTDWYTRPGMGTNDALLVTMMIYLSTPEEGGETNFALANGGKSLPEGGQGFNFKARRGDLAIWWSCTKAGKQDHKSEHSAKPVKKGIKWNATRFLYDNTKKCSTKVMDQIQVPKAAASNVPQKDSTKDTLFGFEMPKGITTGPAGTVDPSLGPPEEPDYLSEGGEVSNEDSMNAFSSLSEDDMNSFLQTLEPNELSEAAEQSSSDTNGVPSSILAKLRKFQESKGLPIYEEKSFVEPPPPPPVRHSRSVRHVSDGIEDEL